MRSPVCRIYVHFFSSYKIWNIFLHKEQEFIYHHATYEPEISVIKNDCFHFGEQRKKENNIRRLVIRSEVIRSHSQFFFSRFLVRAITEYIRLDISSVPTGWFHVVLTLHGEDVMVYYNAITKSGYQATGVVSMQPGSGATVIGKAFTDRDVQRASTSVDELVMWNHALYEWEVAQIYDMFVE